MINKTIVVDVDLTLVDSDLEWLKYLQTQYFNKFREYRVFSLGKERNYDLSWYFPEIKKEDAYNFWSKEDLYDKLVPKEDSVEALRELSDAGWEVLIASHCKKGHFGSKYAWIKKHYPFVKGFFATKEKHYIRQDVFIDDRNDMLNKGDNDATVKIKMSTDYTQEEELKCDKVYVAKSWGDINLYLKKTFNY